MARYCNRNVFEHPNEVEEARKMDESSARDEAARFFGKWTAEYTATKRAQWNERQRAGEWYGDTEDALGISVTDLKRAIAHHTADLTRYLSGSR